MKTSELHKRLKQNGCYFIQHGKKHDVWFSPITNRKFYIPRHKDEVKTGTLKNILAEAGIN